MDIAPVGPFRVASLVWQPRPSAYALIVVVKATYSLRPGDAVLADEQDAILDHDRHLEPEATASLYAPSDVVPVKPRAEVMVVGHAFAPRKQPARSVVVRLAVGDVDKRIEVLCPRVMSQDGSIQEGGGFLQMPLAYERAAGGPGTWNPAGVRADARDAYGRRVLPNLQPVGTVVKGMSDKIEPVGLGPIAPSWPGRMAKLGRHAHLASAGPFWHRSLPEGIDFGYFNTVPPDQQLAALRDDERIVLENLHPEHAKLVTALPGVRPAAFVDRGRGGDRLGLRADTLWIDTDCAKATLTWRGQVPIDHPDAPGRIIVAVESAAREMTWAEVEQMVPPAMIDQRPHAGTMTLPDEVLSSAAAAVPALPFAPSSGASPVIESSPDWPAPAPVPPPPVPAIGSDSSAFRAPAATPSISASPPVIGPAVAESRWAAASPSSAARDTPGTAATAAAAWSPPAATATPAPVIPPAPPPRARAEPRDTVLELIWFDSDAVPRMRRKPAFRAILCELEEHPLDADLDDPAQAKDPAEMEDRREVFDILARAEPTDAEGVNQALLGAVREDGRFVPPIILLAGELSFVFDELETLKATLTAVTPLVAPGDENLQRTCDLATAFLQTPGLLSGPAVAEGLTSRIEDAFGQGKRVVPADYLAHQTELALLGKRHYKKRPVFGALHVRASLHISGSSQPIPTYMVADIADKLPLYRRFRTRLIAEVRLQEDQSETHPTALRVLALARLASLPKP